MKHYIKDLIYKIFSSNLIRVGDINKVYITFDDGPHPENTPKILDILDKNNAKATFFMLGSEMEKFPKIVEETISRGHSIGYHSYNHVSMKKSSIKEIIRDLNYAKKISESFKYNIRTYRPPYGDLSLTGLIWVIFNKWKIVMWSKDSRDSFDSSQQIIKNVSAENLSDGEILLFHDDYTTTVEVLDKILNSYSKQNIKLSSF